jgi:C4-type Zn-finger protein
MSIDVMSVPTSYKVDCPFCRTQFKFTHEDIDDKISCPVCRKKLSIRNLAGEMSALVEPLFSEGFVDLNGGFSIHTT